MTISDKQYTLIVQYKNDLQNYINELYASFPNYTFQEKFNASKIITELKIILFEYQKFIIAYQNQIKTLVVNNSYTVKQGDTLPGIAVRVLGDLNRWKDIYRYNNMTDIMLNAGDVILIPQKQNGN